MAAMRCGCLFSSAENIEWIHKAQSPYSVNTLAVMAARAAIKDTEYVKQYVAEVLAARKTFAAAWTSSASRTFRSQANFVLLNLAIARSRSAMPCAPRRPGARSQLRDPRLRSRHARHASATFRFLADLEQLWTA